MQKTKTKRKKAEMLDEYDFSSKELNALIASALPLNSSVRRHNDLSKL
jgi:hypothetical protein